MRLIAVSRGTLTDSQVATSRSAQARCFDQILLEVSRPLDKPAKRALGIRAPRVHENTDASRVGIGIDPFTKRADWIAAVHKAKCGRAFAGARTARLGLVLLLCSFAQQLCPVVRRSRLCLTADRPSELPPACHKQQISWRRSRNTTVTRDAAPQISVREPRMPWRRLRAGCRLDSCSARRTPCRGFQSRPC
jgi:hypothetical protein